MIRSISIKWIQQRLSDRRTKVILHVHDKKRRLRRVNDRHDSEWSRGVNFAICCAPAVNVYAKHRKKIQILIWTGRLDKSEMAGWRNG